MSRDYREFTKVVSYGLDGKRSDSFDVLEGPCQRCGEVIEMRRWEWAEGLLCPRCISIEAEDALA